MSVLSVHRQQSTAVCVSVVISDRAKERKDKKRG